MTIILLTILLITSPQQKPDTPKPRIVTAVAVCTVVNPPPPEAQPNTTTLDCGKDFALEVPDTYATFKGTEFRVDIFDNGKHAFSEKQPDGSKIHYAPPCPTNGYQRRPLQAPPCNPELKP